MLFDQSFYLSQLGEAARPRNPFRHYLRVGAWRGLDPHPLFDSSFYLDRAPDVVAAGVNPLVHYVSAGAGEGRDPHPLFDSSFYLEQAPDVVAAGVNPLVHYLTIGASEGTDPNPLFDTGYYRTKYGDELPPSANPLVHFVLIGAERDDDAGPRFDTGWYRVRYKIPPELNPLAEHVRVGIAAGRATTPLSGPVLPGVRLLHASSTLASPIEPTLVDRERTVVILLPSLRRSTFSAGPLTALRLGALLARVGERVSFAAIDERLDEDAAPLTRWIAGLAGDSDASARIELFDGADRSIPFPIGPDDVVVATIWWTAHQARSFVDAAGLGSFVYLVQDLEPLFYPASSEYALALASYDLDFVPIVNSSSLLAALRLGGAGRFADEDFAEAALVFEPKPDPAVFNCDPTARDLEGRRLLFYARPRHRRNLYELGLAALRRAVRDGAYGPEWEFLAIGEPQPPAALSMDAMLEPHPWLSVGDYGALLQRSDVLLAPMLSPHPGHPTLDMAACGGVGVTTTYGPKTAASFEWAGPSIVAVPPTVEGLTRGLVDAVERLPEVDRARAAGTSRVPPGHSLDDLIPRLLESPAFAGTNTHARSAER